MSQLEGTLSPPNSNGMASAKSTTRTSLSPLRHRPFGRASIFADISQPLTDRRSSNFSDSLDSTKQSIKSSTDDLLLPRARSPDLVSNHEPSHWHSIPLALALLPALGGLFFQDGSVIVTDLTLLVLAAVFLNWAVRLPWSVKASCRSSKTWRLMCHRDWYMSAQFIRAQEPRTFPDDYPSDTIIEEGSEEEEDNSQPTSSNPETKQTPPKPPKPSSTQRSAASELRIHELLALAACFICPAIGAWLLHYIRGQLSRPSEGLVSNYNLTIFLLASELRPVSHLIKLVQARTLHLQRTLATNPHSHSADNVAPSTVQDLQTRLTELETHIADTTSNGTSAKSPPDLAAQIRKIFQPDLDALNRAVRRYEKRTTLLSLQTESRLQELEKRMSDAITLAAAAERSSQSSRQRPGSGITLMVDWVTTLTFLPLQIAYSTIFLPGRVIGSVVSQVEGYIGQKIKREMKTAGRGELRAGSGSERRRVQGRGPKKVS